MTHDVEGIQRWTVYEGRAGELRDAQGVLSSAWADKNADLLFEVVPAQALAEALKERNLARALEEDAYRYQQAAEDLLNPVQKQLADQAQQLEGVVVELKRRAVLEEEEPDMRRVRFETLREAAKLLRESLPVLHSPEIVKHEATGGRVARCSCGWRGIVCTAESFGAEETFAAHLRSLSVLKEQRRVCPTCGSDDPNLAFDPIRPEQPRRPVIWLSSDGSENWWCPDDFHLAASTQPVSLPEGPGELQDEVERLRVAIAEALPYLDGPAPYAAVRQARSLLLNAASTQPIGVEEGLREKVLAHFNQWRRELRVSDETIAYVESALDAALAPQHHSKEGDRG